jgi:predicted alpha/beta superfamily hydrolase
MMCASESPPVLQSALIEELRAGIAVDLHCVAQKKAKGSQVRKPALSILSLMLLLNASAVAAATFDSAARTSTHTLKSEVLDEERRLIVRVPVNFDEESSYITVFVTDAEWNFELVASYLDYMSDNDVYPPMIVTGVINVNRNRDYIPRPDKHFDDSGGADRFLAFVKDEWVPFMSGRYPAGDRRILLGHSFGGVITLHTLFRQPDLFDAYIALGSSAWIADRVLFEEAEAFFASNRKSDAFVYMAVGEGDGGPTVPSSAALAELFAEKAPASLDWTFDITPRTDHFKNTISGMHDGFMALFPAWSFPQELGEAANADGAQGVKRWFAGKQAALGYRFVPAWFDLGVLALNMAQAGQIDAAVATMAELVTYHPGNPYVASHAANVFEMAGQFDAAAAEYRRAIGIVEARDMHPNEFHVARLQRGLQRVSKAGAE